MNSVCILLFVVSMIFIKCSANSRPNIVLILTDDQDLVLGGITPMVKTRKLIGNMGVTFSNAFVTTPVCCPSRSSLLTGLYLHNHGVKNNSASGGCSSADWQLNHEPKSFVTELKQAGYATFYAGKYLNQYGKSSSGGVSHVPPGWDWWLGLVGNSRYYNYTLSVNGTAKHFHEEYLTDVVKAYGSDFLRQRAMLSGEFLMVLAPPAPHAPFTPASQYKDHFKNVTALRTPNFNIPVNQDKHWLLRLNPNPLPDDFIPVLDKVYRRRWETLLSVDDMVESVIIQLQSLRLLENTFIIFTSDHGYHVGQFGLPWDKRQPYEFDLRVPLLLRGPGVAKKQLIEQPVVNIDLAPTLLDIAGLPIPNEIDGISFLPFLKRPTSNIDPGRLFLVEYYGESDTSSISETCPYFPGDTLSQCTLENLCKCEDSRNNTYACVRHKAATDDFLYCKFEDNENFVELYDLMRDPYQLKNIAYETNSPIMDRYEQALSSLLRCSGTSCDLRVALNVKLIK